MTAEATTERAGRPRSGRVRPDAELAGELHAKTQAPAPRTCVVESRARGQLVADRQRLTQAVVQLAQNAVQHTQPGDEIALGSWVGDGEAWVWVRDSAACAPAEEQDRVFGRFVRAVGDRGEGAGLGSSIVQALAAARGGRVVLDSRPGVGATSTLVLHLDPPSQPRPHERRKGPA